MKRPSLFDSVALNCDLPQFRLKAGDCGVVVEVYSPDAVEVEFMDREGDTVAILTILDEHLHSADVGPSQHPDPLPDGMREFVGSAVDRPLVKGPEQRRP